MRSEVCVCVSAKEERRQEWIRKEGGCVWLGRNKGGF